MNSLNGVEYCSFTLNILQQVLHTETDVANRSNYDRANMTMPTGLLIGRMDNAVFFEPVDKRMPGNP